MEIVSRDEIKTLNNVFFDGDLHDLGVVKIFSEPPVLSEFIPSDSDLAISWVRLEKDQELSVHKHPEASLILICEGSGRTMGAVECDVSAGDMVLVPSNYLHGFKGTQNGFWALSIQFNGKALYEDKCRPNVSFVDHGNVKANKVSELLDINNKCLATFQTSQLLRLVSSEAIAQPIVRERLLDCLQAWSDVFQDLLHIRVAMTSDIAHKKIALEHLEEELGHNENLRAQRSNPTSVIDDAALESQMGWFRHQMLYQSDMTKTLLMHLILEGSGEVFHKAAAETFSDMPHFQEHGEDDGSHVSMGIELISMASSGEIKELCFQLEEGWKMITLLCDRFAEIACGGFSHRLS